MRRILALVAALALAAPAAAVAATVKEVDASDYPTIRLSVVTASATLVEPRVEEDARAVAGLKATNLGRAKSIVLVVDRSRSMLGEPLADAVAAARAFIAAKPPEDRIAVSTYATEVLQLTDFSTATIDADIALRSISVDDDEGTKLNDAVVGAAGALASEPLAARVIILVTDGNETESTASLSQAIAAANRAGASVYVVAIESSLFTPDPLKRLAGETRGSYYGIGSTDALTGVYSSIAEELERTWQLEYVTNARPRDRVTLAVELSNGERATAKLTVPAVPGAPASGTPERSPLLPGFFYTSEWGAPVFAGVVGVLVLLGAGLALASPKGAWLRGRLEPHVAAERRRAVKRERERERFTLAAALFRATEGVFGNLRHWRRIERTVERADIPLRAAEFVYVMAGAGVALALLAAALFASPWAVVVGFAAGALVPYGVAAYKARRRLREFENQLPDILVTMAASLKAGHSFRQGLQSVVEEDQEPASKEFKRVLTETQLGRPMDDALAEMAHRVGSNNFEFVMNAVTIQRQVGGSLAGLFDMVADTVRQRHQFQRKIRGLTAMGRMSAYVLIGLPFLVFGAIFLINREYVSPLLTESAGHKLVLVAVTMMGIGSLILKKIVSFKG